MLASDVVVTSQLVPVCSISYTFADITMYFEESVYLSSRAPKKYFNIILNRAKYKYCKNIVGARLRWCSISLNTKKKCSNFKCF